MKSQGALTVAAVAVGAAALFGIAALEGWLPGQAQPEADSLSLPGGKFSGTAPPESLSPGETVIALPDGSAPKAVPPPPAAAPPVAEAPPPAAKPPAAKPAPRLPTYAQAERRPAPRTCANCGVILSTTFRQTEMSRGGAWEVRVRFDDGTRATLRFPTDPGFRVGHRVVFSDGRLRRD